MPYVYISLFCLWSSMRALLMKYFDKTLLLESLDQFKTNRASQDFPCTCEDLNESCAYAEAHVKLSSEHFVMCGAISVEYAVSIPV